MDDLDLMGAVYQFIKWSIGIIVLTAAIIFVPIYFYM